MPDIIQLLGGVQSGSYIESGVVLQSISDGKYLVDINGREHTLEATISSAGILPGGRVIINRTDTGRYIIGATRQFTSQTLKEIVVDG